MKLNRPVSFVIAGMFAVGAGIFAAGPMPTAQPGLTSAPVYVPNLSQANQPMPTNVFVWDQTTKSADATNGQSKVQFVFNFTNVAQAVEKMSATNLMRLAHVLAVTNSGFWHKRISYITNYTVITNVTCTTNCTPIPVTIIDVRPSCHCTTAQLPPLPWTIAPGTNGQIHLAVDVFPGQTGPLFKNVNVSTDKGYMTLMLHVNILPPVMPKLTEEERARDIAAAKIDRQAVFHGNCAQCHAKNIEGKYGKPLFDTVCAICHEAEHRVDLVPDLRNIKTQTNDEFWRTWIAHGKPGSLMPAFATSEGGPLTDTQIALLAAYLNTAIPSQVPVNK
jgi:mono/diheme cytochrome c family protein